MVADQRIHDGNKKRRMTNKNVCSSGPSGFVPRLTVMVDYGNAPFLWLVDSPDEKGVGGTICDCVYWDESLLITEALWRSFCDWAIKFDKTNFDADDFDHKQWNWDTYHERGIKLSLRLKREVGDAYRVIYEKPIEDPGHEIDERREILADGTLVKLNKLRLPL